MKTKYLFFFAAALLIGFSACKKKEGCIDVNATNYDPEAKVDDGSCIYPIVGCTDPDAINYDPLADTDNGTCEFATNYTPMAVGNTWTMEDEISILGQTAMITVVVEQYNDTTFEGHDWMLQRETISAGTFGDQVSIYGYRKVNTGQVYRRQVYLDRDSVGVESLYMDYPLDLGHEWFDTEAEDNLGCKVVSTSLLSVPAGDFNNAIGIEYTQLSTGIPSVFYFVEGVGPARIDIDYEVPIVGQINVQAELISYTAN